MKISWKVNPKNHFWGWFISITENITIKSDGSIIPHNFDGGFPIIFSPSQHPKIPISGKIPHFYKHWWDSHVATSLDGRDFKSWDSRIDSLCVWHIWQLCERIVYISPWINKDSNHVKISNFVEKIAAPPTQTRCWLRALSLGGRENYLNSWSICVTWQIFHPNGHSSDPC